MDAPTPENPLPGDLGEVDMSIGIDRSRNLIVVNFRTPATWISMPPEMAREAGEKLLECYHMMSMVAPQPGEPGAVDDWFVCEAMQLYGGSFVQLLGRAFLQADAINKARIKKTWPNYWAEYSTRARELFDRYTLAKVEPQTEIPG